MLHHVLHKTLFLHKLKLLISSLLILFWLALIIINLVKLYKLLLFFTHLLELLLELLLHLQLHLLVLSHLLDFIDQLFGVNDFVFDLWPLSLLFAPVLVFLLWRLEIL